MTDQPEKKTLSLKKKDHDHQAQTADPLTRKRSGKRVIRREQLSQGALGKTKAAANKPANRKPKTAKPPANKKPAVTPGDLRLAALDKRLGDTFAIWCDHQPLAPGIEKAVFRFIAEHHISASKRVVKKLLQRHTAGQRYHQNMLQQWQRFELDGTPAGEVSQQERDHAQRQIDSIDVGHSA